MDGKRSVEIVRWFTSKEVLVLNSERVYCFLLQWCFFNSVFWEVLGCFEGICPTILVVIVRYYGWSLLLVNFDMMAYQGLVHQECLNLRSTWNILESTLHFSSKNPCLRAGPSWGPISSRGLAGQRSGSTGHHSTWRCLRALGARDRGARTQERPATGRLHGDLEVHRQVRRLEWTHFW